jgi:hypothetical protein
MIKIISSAGVSTPQTLEGSYLLDRQGNLHPVYLHVPSTKWIGMGLEFLAPIDAEFLLNTGRITAEEADSIVVFNGWEYLTNAEEAKKYQRFGGIEMTTFVNLAELGRYAPQMRTRARELLTGKTVAELAEKRKTLPDFDTINNKWYDYLRNEFTKVGIYNSGRVVDFRIQSDGFNWNKVIIDKVILNPTYGLKDKKFTISRENAGGYKTYFENASLNDILEKDNMILSCAKERRVVGGEIRYVKI